MGVMRVVLTFLAVSWLALVGFLALRGSPFVSELPWVPAGLAEWLDTIRHWRHLLGFGVTGLLVFVIPVPGQRSWRPRRLGALLVLAVVLEVVQLWIPGRTYAHADLIANVAGVGLGWVVVVVAGLQARRWWRRDAVEAAAGIAARGVGRR